MTNREREGAASEEAFALLGHEIRLAILRAFFEKYTPVDPDSLSEAREQRTLSYTEMMAATDMEDSGKFNYHLEKLRGVYVEEVEEGYVPTASAVALYEAVIANRPTESIPGNFDVDETCPNCAASLRGQYEQEYLTVECPACDLFWGITYRFPKNGLAVREDESVYEALYDRMMYHVGLARTGQCPSCAGITSVTLLQERLDNESTPTAEITCGTCSWFVTVDIVSALQFEPQVTKSLLGLGVPLSESSSMRATEQLLPDVTGQVSSDDPVQVTISIPYEGSVAEVVVDENLTVCSTSVEY
jgi:hypothetical protein